MDRCTTGLVGQLADVKGKRDIQDVEGGECNTRGGGLEGDVGEYTSHEGVERG